MKIAKREEIVAHMHKVEEVLRLGKGAAYSGDVDSLANFKRNAERLGLTKYQVWAVYFGKHIDAILNAIRANAEHPVDSTEGLSGRIHDARIYLEILYCLLVEDEESIKQE